MYQAAVAGALANDAARRRRRDVHHAAAERRASRSTPKTGRVFWIYRHTLDPTQIVCCGANNRGLGDSRRHAVHGHARRAARRDRREERPAAVEHAGRPSSKAGYSVTLAPLVVKDKVIVGVGGGEYGIRGFIAAYDAKSGQEAWRFYTIPGAGRDRSARRGSRARPIAATFCDPEAWKHGGGSVWVTGSCDPVLNLTYWGVGNAGPDWNADQRPGDNLYTDSVVALDADTGKLRVALPVHAARSTTTTTRCRCPVLADISWHGGPLKAMVWANRNGNFYVLDRDRPDRFLIGEAVRQGELDGRDSTNAAGRIQTPQPAGSADLAGQSGRHELVLAVVTAPAPDCSTFPRGKTTRRSSPARRSSIRKAVSSAAAPAGRTSPCLARLPSEAAGAVRSTTGRRPRVTAPSSRIDPENGSAQVEVPDMTDVTDRRHPDDGVGSAVHGQQRRATSRRSTRGPARCSGKRASDVAIASAPITYQVDGKQYVTRGLGSVARDVCADGIEGKEERERTRHHGGQGGHRRQLSPRVAPFAP